MLLSLKHSNGVFEVRSLELALFIFLYQNPAFSPMIIFCFMWGLIENSRENSDVSRFFASRVTIHQVYPSFVWSLCIILPLWEACFLYNKVQTTMLFCLPTTPIFILSFHIFGNQFHCPILCAPKPTRISKS